jgi:hypothetical protein
MIFFALQKTRKPKNRQRLENKAFAKINANQHPLTIKVL